MCRFRAGSLGASVLLLLGAIGCSGNAELNPVQGKVTHKGQPLNGATVTFVSQSSEEGTKNFPSGTTKEDGTFSLQTGGADGAPAGNYKVTIVLMEASKVSEGMSLGSQVDRFQGAYADPAASALSVEVKSGPNQLEPFDLK